MKSLRLPVWSSRRHESHNTGCRTGRRKTLARTTATIFDRLGPLHFEILERRTLLTGALALDATADVASVVHGGTVNYHYDVTFVGVPGVTEADGSSIVVSDDTCSPVSPILNAGFNVGDADQDGNLDDTETWEYSCTFTVPTHSDSEADPIVSVSFVTGDDVNGDPATQGNDSVSVDINHSTGTLAIVKNANVSSIAHGGTITYTFDVTHTPGTDGSPAQNIVITDAGCDSGTLTGPTGDTNSNNRLDTGETWQFTCTRLVALAHSTGEQDPITNTATVDGTDLDGDALLTALSNTVSVDVTHSTGTLAILKSANVTTVAHGGSVTYTFDVRYTPGADGSPAQNIAVTDPKCDTGTLVGPTGDANGNTQLDAAEVWRYTCTHAVAATHSAGEEDPIVNTAVATGQDLDGEAVTSGTSNTVNVNILHTAGTLSITKNANRTSVPHGGVVNYSFNVTYTPGADGSPAQSIVVSDPQCNAAPTLSSGDTNSNSRLDTGETWVFTCSFTAPAAHAADETDPIVNTATVSGQDLDGEAVTGATSNTVSVDLAHGTISGKKFLDLNGDGEQDSDEPGLRNWTINAFSDTNGNGVFDQGTDTLLATELTDFDGNYTFSDILAGTIFIREVVRVGFTQTTPDRDFILVGDETHTDVDFGNSFQGATLIPDPHTAGDTALLVVGTQRPDKIAIGRHGRTTSTTVSLNGNVIGFFNPNGSIIIYGLRGDDRITTHPDITRPMIIDGGDGDDRMEGGASHDVMIGHEGRDTLLGKIGLDIMIGGAGQDRLTGGDDDDILIAGRTDFDDNQAALTDILAEWKSSRPYETRRNNIRDGSGGGTRLNGNFFLDNSTTHDDAIADFLAGNSERDWFFAEENGNNADRIKGLEDDESVDSL
jgi:hypothetical protein